MSETSTLIGYAGQTIGREELALVPTPAGTETHRQSRITRLCRRLSKPWDFAILALSMMSMRSRRTG